MNPDAPADATRRQFLRGLGGALALGAAAPLVSAGVAPVARRRVALADRAIAMRQNLGVFEIARVAGCDGAEIDLGRIGSRGDMTNRLADPAGRRQFVAAAAAAGVEIAAINATAFAAQSFLNHARADEILIDWMTALARTGVRTGVLPFGIACDLVDPAVRGRVVERLKPLGDEAADGGVVIALDTPLEAADLATLLDAVGSPAVQACVRLDTDAAAAVDLLGPHRVAQLRYRDDGAAAGRSPALPKDWPGWLVVQSINGVDPDIAADCASAARRLRAMA